jgi:Fe-S-cluster containining protein
LLFSPEQRFTCAECGRCCRRTTVPVTAREAETYRKAEVERFFRESDDDPDGSTQDAFEPIPGHAPLLRIRKRRDGACGFLTPEGRCRIHETLGADRKPLSCRLFPFRFHPAESDGRDTVVTASFACPTVIANEGSTIASQKREIQALHTAWIRELPEAAATVELLSGHRAPRASLPLLRTTLCRILDRRGADGEPDLRANLRRIGALLEDLSRRRVVSLAPDDFVEYLRLTGGYAITNDNPAPARAPAGLARLLFRGFLLAALMVQLRLDPLLAPRPVALRVTLFRLLAHLHGLGPGAAGFNFGRAIGMRFCIEDPEVRAIAHRSLRAGFETLGTGRRAVVDEIAMIVAHLNAACVLGGMHAVSNGKSSVDAESFTQGLLESSDLSHADAGGHLSTLLTTLSGGLEALYLFPPLPVA